MQFSAVFGYVHHRLVGVDRLFEVDRPIRHEGEGRIRIKVAVQCLGLLLPKVAVGVDAGQECRGRSRRASARSSLRGRRAPCIAPSVRPISERVREGLVNRNVVRPPAEMGRGRGFYACARRTRDGRRVHLPPATIPHGPRAAPPAGSPWRNSPGWPRAAPRGCVRGSAPEARRRIRTTRRGNPAPGR